VVDGNVDAILADTSALPTSQDAWSIATGFSTFDPATDVIDHVALVDTTTDLTNAPDLAAVQDVTDKIDTALEADGPVYKFTANALEEVPAVDISGLSVAVDLDPVVDAVNLAVAALQGADVTIISPVAANGTITIYAGDDYAADHGREIAFAVADATHALALAAAGTETRLKCTQATWDSASVTSTTDGYVVTFEPTHDQTAALSHRSQPYELEATLADGGVVTLATGGITLTKDIPEVVAL